MRGHDVAAKLHKEGRRFVERRQPELKRRGGGINRDAAGETLSAAEGFKVGTATLGGESWISGD